MAIENIRQKINEVDDKLLSLFLERMTLSEDVARSKKELGLPIVNREREREVLARIMEKAGDKDEYAYQLFSKLMDLSKARQRELFAGDTKVRVMVEKALRPIDELLPKKGSVAVQGIEGANAQVACDKMLPMGNILYVKTFEAVFNAVESGFCEYGVLPIENNTNGSVRAVYELLLRKNFSIVRATSLHIRH
ncbi:MAG: chorismate mutase, partial [Oscillospiraceae bacterium]|nr:chorismate mutase [Oscillospiraceae bacterium]